MEAYRKYCEGRRRNPRFCIGSGSEMPLGWLKVKGEGRVDGQDLAEGMNGLALVLV
jgi:hypothetical protein